MKRLTTLILIFGLMLSIPLGYFILGSYGSLEQEEMARLRFFAETLFSDMESELAQLVVREEARAVDEYNPGSGLAALPAEDYILGYFQNNPDGSFQTPHLSDTMPVSSDKESGMKPDIEPVVQQLQSANGAFNSKRTAASATYEIEPRASFREIGQEPSGFADKFLSRPRRQKAHLGQEKKRVEEITVAQALNMNQAKEMAESDEMETDRSESRLLSNIRPSAPAPSPEVYSERSSERAGRDSWEGIPSLGKTENAPQPRDRFPWPEPAIGRKLQAEVAPIQSVFIDPEKIFIFRRVMIGNQIYRQGLVIWTRPFLDHLADRHFRDQPIAHFTRLSLSASNGEPSLASVSAGASVAQPRFALERGFPRPFSFLRASLVSQKIPPSENRATLSLMIAVLGGIMLIGLFAIYHSARVVVDHSERRAKFVSSVTHELKTPLTNIRMYIEMLEQGIARTPEREAEYFRILGSESARLSRLINNVLEYSKLEKRQFKLQPESGNFAEVLDETVEIMGAKARRENFLIETDHHIERPFFYDREVMVQVLVNLIENCMKFGRDGKEKRIRIRVRHEGRWVRIDVSDTGPGIPRHALKKVFHDFYRAEPATSGAIRGTGIGLAFVSKVMQLAKGRVIAANNDGPGCTITLLLRA